MLEFSFVSYNQGIVYGSNWTAEDIGLYNQGMRNHLVDSTYQNKYPQLKSIQIRVRVITDKMDGGKWGKITKTFEVDSRPQ